MKLQAKLLRVLQEGEFERLGSGNGRVYTLSYQGMDAAGNAALCSTTVNVPHDQR